MIIDPFKCEMRPRHPQNLHRVREESLNPELKPLLFLAQPKNADRMVQSPSPPEITTLWLEVGWEVPAAYDTAEASRSMLRSTPATPVAPCWTPAERLGS